MPRGEFDRSERRARTRELLLDAAARVYAERGIDRASLDEIAEAAGFTKGALYDHFGSKENLLFALLDEHLSAEIDDQLALFAEHPDPATRPRAGAERWLSHLIEEPETFRLFVESWVHGQRDEAMRERILAALDAWRAMFRGFGEQRARELGESRSEPLLEGTSNLMVALGLGFAMMRLADPDRVAADLLGAGYVLLLGAIESSPEARALITEASGITEASRITEASGITERPRS